MSEFYSLEKAANELGISPEDLARKAQSREIRAFQDSGSWQFRKNDIEDMIRQRGMGSDPELALSDLDLETMGGESRSEDIDLSDFQLGVATPEPDPERDSDLAPETASDDEDIRIDDLAVPPDLTGSSSTIIGMKPSGRKPGDSDVRIVPEDLGSNESDVRLSPIGGGLSDSDVTLVSDDSSADVPIAKLARPPVSPHPESGSDASGETTLARSPLLDSSAEIEAVSPGDSDSDFELSPSSVIDALQPESGSDFELTALDSGSDEFEATPTRSKLGPSDSDVTGVEPSASGVNLGHPSDSGINLATAGLGSFDDDSMDLAPLDDFDDAVAAAPKKPRPAPAPTDDPGATALPIRQEGEKDLFEDTDFEVDALDTGGDDRTMQLDATSDFGFDDSDSASEVFAIDEDEVDDNAATALGAAPALSDSEISGEAPTGESWGDVSGEGSMPDVGTAPSTATAPVTAGTPTTTAAPRGGTLLTNAQGPEWGTPWVVALGLTAVFMLLLAFVGLDLVSNLYEFRSDGPASGLVSSIAGLMGGEG